VTRDFHYGGRLIGWRFLIDGLRPVQSTWNLGPLLYAKPTWFCDGKPAPITWDSGHWIHLGWRFWRRVSRERYSAEVFKPTESDRILNDNDKVRRRAIAIAEATCDAVWGGKHGWEREEIDHKVLILTMRRLIRLARAVEHGRVIPSDDAL
jgi:hypothetical protein